MKAKLYKLFLIVMVFVTLAVVLPFILLGLIPALIVGGYRLARALIEAYLEWLNTEIRYEL